jgi:hypothetical protein
MLTARSPTAREHSNREIIFARLLNKKAVPPGAAFHDYSELSLLAGLVSLGSFVSLLSAAGVSFSFFLFSRFACPDGDLWSVA